MSIIGDYITMPSNKPSNKKPLEDQYPNGGPRICLKCDIEFFSIDIVRNRICKQCNKENSLSKVSSVFRLSEEVSSFFSSEEF